jgi:hypothetical protein
MMLSLDFSHGFFIRDIRKTYTMLILFSPKLSHGVIGDFLSIHNQLPSFFHMVFEGLYMMARC